MGDYREINETHSLTQNLIRLVLSFCALASPSHMISSMMSSKRGKMHKDDRPRLVPGTGYISDESDFCGDDNLKDELEDLVMSSDPTESAYWTYQARLPSTINRKTLAFQQDTSISKSVSPRATPPRNTASLHPAKSAADFLHRLPPSTTTFATAGPWLWVQNPQASTPDGAVDEARLAADGHAALVAYLDIKATTEKAMAGKSKQTITKKLTPYRTKLETDLRLLAQECRLNYGKWMLFPDESEVDRTWLQVAKAVAAGELGPMAKVATKMNDARSDRRLICIYTRDFADVADIRRVVRRLGDMGLAGGDGAGDIWYKCDYYTHLGIESGNEYGLKASMYGSRDMLK